MKLKLGSDTGQDYFPVEFLSHWDKKAGLVVEDFNLPRQIERSLGLVELVFPDAIPLGILNTIHGGTGIAFVDFHGQAISDHQGWALGTRVSYCPEVDEEGVGESQTLGSLHIGVSVRKEFTPSNYEELNPDQPVLQGNYAENMVFSMRWKKQDGVFVFDDWNSPELWLADRDNERLDKKRFNAKRTSFCRAEIKEGVKSSERKRARIKLTKNLYDIFHSSNPTEKDVLDIYFGRGSTNHVPEPIIGYGSVLGVLNGFGKTQLTDSDKLSQMTPDEGIEYTFTKVLPAMLEYAKQ